METVLEWKDYSLSFYMPDGEVEAVRGVNLSLKKGEILALVGESGCGKSVLCKSVMKLLPSYGKVKNGQILLNGTDITHLSQRQMRKYRGKDAAMVFQDPMTSLNPTVPVGKQIMNAVLSHEHISKEAAKDRAMELMHLANIPDPEMRFSMQPHFFSGGMRQRCVLAIALAGNPEILFADEPTTALDVTVQAKILDLLLSIREKTGISIIFVSHDLGVVARIADRIAVMYAGRIIEYGTAQDIFYDPRHPYTWGLLSAMPSRAKKGDELYSIPGMPPVLMNLPKGDPFAPRNAYALAIDYEQEPGMYQISETHSAATWLLDPRAPRLSPPQGIGRMGGSDGMGNRGNTYE
ncbi:MAG: ABC transporter ATP-binding protein [Eubacteriales bacterium]|nr:ABC transporter ATP-binding protein [Eubacteriales bacterium]